MADFSNYKFRASSLKNIMVSSRTKKDALSETTKTFLQEIWIQEVYGRKKTVITPAMQKGTIVESDSLSLVQQVHGKTYFKNKTRLENDFINGTPDVIDKANSHIIDIKSSWDIWSFVKTDEDSARKDYYYQILGYMWLTDTTKGSLVFSLVDTPEHLIESEMGKFSRSLTDAQLEDMRKNYIYGDIPAEERIKEYSFEVDQEIIELVKARIIECRNYLQTFSMREL